MVKLQTSEFFMAVGANIASARKQLNLTQEELAKTVGLKQQVIASYEAGRRRIPLPTLCQIAKALHLQIEDLIPGEPTPVRKGPAPVILHQIEKLKNLPDDKQKIIFTLIDSWISDHSPSS